MTLFKHLLMSALTISALAFATHGYAANVSYQAISDFPVIDAGQVPYYRDQPRQALAIDAAVEQYRDRFAKATVVYDGQPGNYRITLVAIAELDGEADYRLSIDGEIVGEASNPEVEEEFVVVRHQFDDINLPAGAIIGIESLANSNGKIPENDEFAFARGRWMALELSDSDEIVPDQVISGPDLSIVANVSNDDIKVGDNIELILSISNAPDSEVATGVVVSVSMPEGALELVDQSLCNVAVSGLQCQLQELPAGSSVDLSIDLRALSELADTPVVMSVSADQNDYEGTNGSVELMLSVNKAKSESSSAEVPGIDTTAESESDTDSSSLQAPTDPSDGDTGEATVTAVNADSTSSSGGALSALMFTGLFAWVILRRTM